MSDMEQHGNFALRFLTMDQHFWSRASRHSFCHRIYLFLFFLQRLCFQGNRAFRTVFDSVSLIMQQCLCSTQHSGGRNVGVPIGAECLPLRWVCCCFAVTWSAQQASRHTCPYLPLPECLTRRLWEKLREPKCFRAQPPLFSGGFRQACCLFSPAREQKAYSCWVPA